MPPGRGYRIKRDPEDGKLSAPLPEGDSKAGLDAKVLGCSRLAVRQKKVVIKLDGL